MKIEDSLKEYLTSRMERQTDIKIKNLQRAPQGGSRECYTFTLEWRGKEALETGHFVLRRDPDSSLLESDRETEFRVLESLKDSGVHVPRVYWLEKGGTVLERPFMIMEQIIGEVTPFFQLISPDDAALRNGRIDATVRELATLHNVDWRKCGLDFLGVPENATAFAERQVAHWEKEFRQVKLDAQPILTEAFLWLRDHIPQAKRLALLHGDFKTDNLLFDGPEVKGLLDWEMAAIGDPVADIAWFCLDRWSVDGLCCGLVEREAFIEKWQEFSGLEADDAAMLFWTVFSNVKLAMIHLRGGYSFVTKATRDIRMAYPPFENIRLLKNLCDLIK